MLVKNWKEQIEEVLNYCFSKKWSVLLNKEVEDRCFPDSKIIHINTKQNFEYQFYSLLHEVGHMIEHQNASWYNKRYPGFYFSRNSLTYKISMLEEEINAWNKGLKLARKLGLYINDKNFHKYKAIYVSSYLSSIEKKKKIIKNP